MSTALNNLSTRTAEPSHVSIPCVHSVVQKMRTETKANLRLYSAQQLAAINSSSHTSALEALAFVHLNVGHGKKEQVALHAGTVPEIVAAKVAKKYRTCKRPHHDVDLNTENAHVLGSAISAKLAQLREKMPTN